MRGLIVGTVLICGCAAALAKDVTVSLSDEDQRNFSLAPTILEQCISAATMRGDAGTCRSVYVLLENFSRVVGQASREAQSPAKSPETK